MPRPPSDWIRSNVLGLVAIFIALGGTAYATHPGGQNTISTDDIQNLAVTTPKLGPEAVTTPKLGPEAVTQAKLRAGSVGRPQLLNGAVIREKINAGAVNADKLANGAVTTEKVANGAINSAKVADESLTGADILDNSLTGADINESTLTQRIRWRGKWVAPSSTCGPPFPCAVPEPYAVNDAVEYQGSSYIAKAGCSFGCDPPDSSSDWDLLAQKGATPTLLWAVVDSGAFTAGDATLIRGSGAVSVGQPAGDFGNYFVTFDRDVSNCAYVATIGAPGGIYTGNIGEIQATKSTTNDHQVRVLTYNSATTRINRGFNLAVHC